MSRTSLFFVLCAFALIGCNQGPKGYVNNEDTRPAQSAPPATMGDPSGTSQENPPNGQSQASTNPPAEPGISGDTDANPNPKTRPVRPSDIENPTVDAPEIKPAGSDGWTSLAQPPRQFGQMVDKAIANLSNVAGTFDIELRNEVMEGNKQGRFLIASPNQYAIDTVDMQKPTAPNRTLADGKTKKSLTEAGWSRPKPVASQGNPISAKVSDDLARNFSRLMFESLTERRPTWAPILEGLIEEGFAVTLETKNISTAGVMRPYTRLVATRSGKGLNKFEVRFDGIRNVPLTVRMISTSASGKPITGEWRGRWQFNQKVGDEIAKL